MRDVAAARTRMNRYVMIVSSPEFNSDELLRTANEEFAYRLAPAIRLFKSLQVYCEEPSEVLTEASSFHHEVLTPLSRRCLRCGAPTEGVPSLNRKGTNILSRVSVAPGAAVRVTLVA
jgi:hypothetical protein